MEEKKVVVVLPAYNEEERLEAVIRELRGQASLERATLVVVDDGSTDRTADIARSLGATVASHRGNKGLGETFRTAVEYALAGHYDIMVFFDADGQFSADDIARVVAPLVEEQCDFVLGSRFLNGTPKGMPLAKVIGNRLVAKFIAIATRTKLHDVSCGFRAYSREALLRLNVIGDFTYTQEVILDLLFKRMSVREVPITVKYFPGRKSLISSNLWRYGWRVLKILVRTIRDYRPMQFFGSLGVMLFIVGLVLDAWMIWFFVQTKSFSPYKVVGFAGAFLNFLGITVWLIGFVADMLNRIRKAQDELLYFKRRQYYGGGESFFSRESKK